jgi:hypothetical protein
MNCRKWLQQVRWEEGNMRRLLFVLTLGLLLLGLSGCDKDSEVKQAAAQAIKEWAQAAGIQYQDYGTKVMSNDSNKAQVAVAILVRDQGCVFGRWLPAEGVVEVQRNGKEWDPQPVRDLSNPFEAIRRSENCRTEYLCIRITSHSNFEWKGQLGFGNCQGWSNNADFSIPPGETRDAYVPADMAMDYAQEGSNAIDLIMLPASNADRKVSLVSIQLPGQ